jgi:hypothetical protein
MDSVEIVIDTSTMARMSASWQAKLFCSIVTMLCGKALDKRKTLIELWEFIQPDILRQMANPPFIAGTALRRSRSLHGEFCI